MEIKLSLSRLLFFFTQTGSSTRNVWGTSANSGDDADWSGTAGSSQLLQAPPSVIVAGQQRERLAARMTSCPPYKPEQSRQATTQGDDTVKKCCGKGKKKSFSLLFLYTG